MLVTSVGKSAGLPGAAGAGPRPRRVAIISHLTRLSFLLLFGNHHKYHPSHRTQNYILEIFLCESGAEVSEY